MLEIARVLTKSNAEKKDQIAELSRQIVDRYSDLHKQKNDADALKDALVKVELILRKNINAVAELRTKRSLLNDSRKELSKLKTKVEKLQSLTNNENESLKNQVTEQVQNKNEHDKLKKCYKPLLKEYETQIETINNDETAIDESKSEIDHMNVTVADLNYALNKVQEAIRVTDYYADNQ